jgi:hypothetical protein
VEIRQHASVLPARDVHAVYREGRWRIVVEGEGEFAAYRDREEAVMVAQTMAYRRESTCVIHRMDGSVESA